VVDSRRRNMLGEEEHVGEEEHGADCNHAPTISLTAILSSSHTRIDHEESAAKRHR
jgi:hypothetical protein